MYQVSRTVADVFRIPGIVEANPLGVMQIKDIHPTNVVLTPVERQALNQLAQYDSAFAEYELNKANLLARSVVRMTLYQRPPNTLV